MNRKYTDITCGALSAGVLLFRSRLFDFSGECVVYFYSLLKVTVSFTLGTLPLPQL